jgi:hypothetical protein
MFRNEAKLGFRLNERYKLKVDSEHFKNFVNYGYSRLNLIATLEF